MRPLSPRQQRFASLYVTKRCGVNAAIGAGYAPGPGIAVTASRLLRKANVQAAIAAQEALVAAEMGVTRQKVIRELQEAVDEARRIGDPMAMIAAWREIARICGYYAPERVQTISDRATSDVDELHRLEEMSDADLALLAFSQAGVADV